MIYRKLIKQGNNAFTITLPIDWLREQHINAGDTLFLEIEKQNIVIYSQIKKDESKISINLEKSSRPQMFQIILSLYIKGYECIEIKHQDLKTILDVEKELTGMLLEDYDEEKALFKSIVSQEETSKELLTKIAFNLKKIVDKIESLSLEELIVLEKLMDKLILFQLRNYNKYSNLNKEYSKMLQCYVFDMIGDILIEIKTHAKKRDRNLPILQKYVNLYVDLLLKNKIPELISELRIFRDEIEQKTFVDGLSYSLAELMYNFIGYFDEETKN
jgi:hypothetical protein